MIADNIEPSQLASAKEAFLQNGYVLVKGVMPTDKIDQLRAEDKAIFIRQILQVEPELDSASLTEESTFEKYLYRLHKADFGRFLGAAKLCQHLISLHELTLSEAVTAGIKALGIDQPAICVKPIIYFNSRHIAKEEAHYKTPPHQDWRSMQGSLNSMVVWIPLIDINSELGALEIVPGSHRNGLYETSSGSLFEQISYDDISESSYVSVEVEKGDALFFNSLLVHRSGNNTSDHIRWSIHVRFNDIADQKFIERKYPHPYQVYIPDRQLVTPDFPGRDDLQKAFNS